MPLVANKLTYPARIQSRAIVEPHGLTAVVLVVLGDTSPKDIFLHLRKRAKNGVFLDEDVICR